MITRCVNLDWLEVHVLEPVGQPHDADYFRAHGFVVHERDYGTRVYKEMFILDGTDGLPLIEVRRNPKSQGLLGIHDPEESHLRLTNRACYLDNPAEIMASFIQAYNYEFRRISRVDICLDFEQFDYGDDPQAFLTRYIKHRYAKINQCNRTTHGIDRWTGCVDNSISWGSPTSDIGTKMYNKTLELRNPHDSTYSKPYIRWAWKESGLVDDPVLMIKYKDGVQYTPQIWRVEFSIRSSVRNWFKIELNGVEKNYQSVRNTLEQYDSGEKLLTMFASLAQHYFRFKYYEQDKRKDRCKDKLLFNWGEMQCVYKVGKTAPLIGDGKSGITPLQSLINKIRYYQQTHPAKDIHRACQTLIEAMERDCIRVDMTHPWSYDEIKALQAVLNLKTSGINEDAGVLLKEIKKLLKLNDNTIVF